MKYKQLTFNQRCKIAAFWKAGYTQKHIDEEVQVSPATISRELKRNRRWNGVYSPEQADGFYQGKRENSRKPKTFTPDIQQIVIEKLQLNWSPEQISGYGKRHLVCIKVILNPNGGTQV